MSEKSELYQQLKSVGVDFGGKAYVSWTVPELEALALAWVAENQGAPQPQVRESAPEIRPPSPTPPPAPPAPDASSLPRPARLVPALRQAAPATLDELREYVLQAFEAQALVEGTKVPYREHEIPVQNRGADRAGLTYSWPEGVPIRVDEAARIWFQDEVAKPAIPKSRMTRKTRYLDPGVKEERSYLPNGDLDEIYEVAGDAKREMTVTVTLPSSQVGRHIDLRFPFSIHTYNGAEGFDRDEVIRFFGGMNLVPGTAKTLYVGSQLCFHIPSTRETIQDRFNTLQRSFQ